MTQLEISNLLVELGVRTGKLSVEDEGLIDQLIPESCPPGERKLLRDCLEKLIDSDNRLHALDLIPLFTIRHHILFDWAAYLEFTSKGS